MGTQATCHQFSKTEIRINVATSENLEPFHPNIGKIIRNMDTKAMNNDWIIYIVNE